MPDIFSYSVRDIVPFSAEVLAAVYQSYVESLGHWMIVLLLYSAIILALLVLRPSGWISTLLAPLWVFTGGVFMAQYYGQIIWMADYLCWAFLVQGVCLTGVGLFSSDQSRPDWTRFIGILIFAAASFVPVSAFYSLPLSIPLLLAWTPLSLSFGTLGMLLALPKPLLFRLLAGLIPLLFIVFEGMMLVGLQL